MKFNNKANGNVIRRAKFSGRAIVISMLVLLPALACCQAQAVPPLNEMQVRARLKTQVHLALGQCTVAQFTERLSKQCDVAVRAEDYLKDRLIIAQMEGMSGQEALETLAELNGWRSYVNSEHSVILARPRVRLPEKPEEITAAVQTALPLDARQYLGVGVPLEELAMRAKLQDRRLFTDASTRAHPEFAPVSDLITRKATSVVKSRQMRLVHKMLDMLTTKKSLPYSLLTPEQQQEIVTIFILKTLAETDPNFQALLSGTLNLSLLDTSNMEIWLQEGNGLNYGKSTIDPNGAVFFAGGGGQIEGLKAVRGEHVRVFGQP